MLVVAEFDLPKIGYAEWRSRDRVPKFAQRVHPLLRRIAGDDRRVDGADRDSGNPIGMQIDLGQGLINARLISPERAAALKQQRDLLARSAPLRHGKFPRPPCCAETSLRRLRPCSQVVAGGRTERKTTASGPLL